MAQYFDRYSKFRINGTVKNVPFIKIPLRNTDYYTTYRAGQTRLDSLSYQYYEDPNYGWLILQANPGYGGLEFLIPDNTVLRIPYPLPTVLSQYNTDLERYDQLYGIE